MAGLTKLDILGGIIMTEIRLRTFEEEDLPFMHNLFNDREVMSYWFEEAYYPKTSLKEMFQKYGDNPNTRSFIIAKDNEQIGLVQFMFIDTVSRNAEYAIMIDPSKQGKGYAHHATKQAIEYAFNVLNLHKLYLWADEENEKAINIYKKHGFKVDCIIHEHFFVNGYYHNAVVMDIFQRDYLTQ